MSVNRFYIYFAHCWKEKYYTCFNWIHAKKWVRKKRRLFHITSNFILSLALYCCWWWCFIFIVAAVTRVSHFANVLFRFVGNCDTFLCFEILFGKEKKERKKPDIFRKDRLCLCSLYKTDTRTFTYTIHSHTNTFWGLKEKNTDFFWLNANFIDTREGGREKSYNIQIDNTHINALYSFIDCNL